MIKTAVRLSEIDVKRSESTMPGWTSKKRLLSGVSFFLFLLLGSLYVLRDQPDPMILFISAAMLLLGVTMYLAFINFIFMTSQPFRLWWLTLPHSRLSLVLGKAIAYVRIMGKVGILLLLVCAAHYGIAVYRGNLNSIPWIELVTLVGSILLFVIAAVPLSVMLGMSVSLLYKGWMRWFLMLPYYIILMLPIVLIPVLMDITQSAMNYLTPNYILLYALGMICFGWPISYLLMKAVANSGINNIANQNSHFKIGAGTNSKDINKKQIKQTTGSFSSLYQLERSFFKHYGSLLPIRMIKYLILVVIPVLSFFAADSVGAMRFIPIILMVLPVLFALTWNINSNYFVFCKNRLLWWLGFPHQRRLLTFTHILAVWVTTMRLISMLLLAFWAGAGLGLIMNPIDPESFKSILNWFLYTFIFYTVSLTFTLGAFQISYYLVKSKSLAFLIMPLYIFALFQPTLILNHLFVDNLELLPNWTFLGIIIGIGIPISVFCFFVGSKYLHTIIQHDLSPKVKKSRGL